MALHLPFSWNGARGVLTSWLPCQSVSWSVSKLVGQLFSWLIGQLVSHSVGRLVSLYLMSCQPRRSIRANNIRSQVQVYDTHHLMFQEGAGKMKRNESGRHKREWRNSWRSSQAVFTAGYIATETCPHWHFKAALNRPNTGSCFHRRVHSYWNVSRLTSHKPCNTHR